MSIEPAVNVAAVAPPQLKVRYNGVVSVGSASFIAMSEVSIETVGPTAVARFSDAPITLVAVLIVQVHVVNDGATGTTLCFRNVLVMNDFAGRLHRRIVSPVAATAFRSAVTTVSFLVYEPTPA